MNKEIIIACDFKSKDDYLSLLKSLHGEKSFIKIGMELFYSLGSDAIHLAKDKGHKVFLDLKLHDIPTTIYKSMKQLAKLDIDITNLHAAGGIEMMNAAYEGIKEVNPNIKLIGVTQLTSTSQKIMNSELLIPGTIDDIVINYAKNVHSVGLDGVVCSALETKRIKKHTALNFLCVTPGIRLTSDNPHDQKRIMTPKEAINEGSDYLVIGRSITQSKNPKEIIQSIRRSLNE